MGEVCNQECAIFFHKQTPKFPYKSSVRPRKESCQSPYIPSALSKPLLSFLIHKSGWLRCVVCQQTKRNFSCTTLQFVNSDVLYCQNFMLLSKTAFAVWNFVLYSMNLKLCGMYSHIWFSKFCIPVYSEHLCWIPHLRLRYNGLAKIMSEAEWRCSWIHSTEWRTCHLSRLVDMPLWLTLASTGTGHLTLVIFRIRERGKKLYRMLQNFPYNWKGFQKFCISQTVEMYIFQRWI